MKTVFITGATDGLGKATAIHLAKKGYKLILHGRNPKKGDELLNQLAQIAEQRNFHYYNADFADLSQIISLADKILENHSELDILVNNAGLGVESSRRNSKDGIELIFQVDYLATYILSKKLLPLIASSRYAQIINVASAGQSAVDFEDPLLENSWSGVQAYCQAKLSQITLAVVMARENNNVLINAVHPASYMPTKIVTHMFTPQSAVNDGVKSLVNLIENNKDVTGKYFFMQNQQLALPAAYQKLQQENLIELSKKLTGI